MKPIELKSLEKARKIYDEIVKIDKEIVSIEKLAIELLDDKCKLDININVENLTKKEKEKTVTDALVFDDENTFSFLAPLRFNFSDSIKKDLKNRKEHAYSFTDRECVIVLDTIVKIKNSKREILLNSLKSLGYKI